MKRKWIAVLLIVGVIISGCSRTEPVEDETEPTVNTTIDTSNYTILDKDSMFTEDDFDSTYDEKSATRVDFDALTQTSSIDGVTYDGSQVLISKAGTYVLTGTLKSGYVKVAVGANDTVHIVLDNAHIESDQFASLYVYQVDSLKVTLKEGTTNSLSNTNDVMTDGEIRVDGVIFSRDDLVINGSGLLTLESLKGNGLVGKDDVVITGGVLQITAFGHGIEANNSVRIVDASLSIEAAKDGIQADHEDVTKGYVYIQDASLDIQAENDGIQASSVLQLQSGTYTIVTGDGTEGEIATDASAKGLKATGLIYVLGGQFDLNTADDAVHANGNVLIDGGVFTIQAVDDGIHADQDVVISNATISILESYEGIEGAQIVIESGSISIVSSDDGLNASDGSASQNPGFGGQGPQAGASNNVSITINGGRLTIYAKGDGIDSNGNLSVNGGEIFVSAPVNAQEGGLDFDGTATITKGIVVATGSSRMSQNFTTAEQGSLLLNLDSTYEANSSIVVSDSEGYVLIDVKAQAAYNSIVISHPDMVMGDSITVTLNGDPYEVTLSSNVMSSGNNAQGSMQQGPRGNRP